jgi:hypothetical protein
MASTIASTLARCPGCGRFVEIDLVASAHVSSEYGGFILECLTCGRVFEDYVGQDAKHCSVRCGARLLERFEGSVQREQALRKYGLAD